METDEELQERGDKIGLLETVVTDLRNIAYPSREMKEYQQRTTGMKNASCQTYDMKCFPRSNYLPWSCEIHSLALQTHL